MGQQAQNVITLKLEDGQWVGTFGGPIGEDVRELFGTDTIPTPYYGSYSADKVLAAIKANNPDCEVRFA